MAKRELMTMRSVGEGLASLMREQALPTGTVSFLFSDIEGSTVRWDRDPEAMRIAVRRHDGLMRSAIAENHGYVFKTVGDAFCAVFARCADAVNAAIAAQLALQREDFSAVDGVRVRMAIHCGTSDERDGDYFGPTLNRVARLLAIGHGGQILLSEVAFKTVESRKGTRDYVSLGLHRLKDLTEPEHVYQVLAPGLPDAFAPLASLTLHNTNLPHRLTALVGRQIDVAAISALLRTSRLVTIFGTGGLGKTRCALQVGADVLELYRDGAWFVDLAPVADPALVANAAASVLGVRESASTNITDTLVAHLRQKQLLVILDNCEHVVASSAELAAKLLEGCPNVSVLATSRETLRIEGEDVYGLPPLSMPAHTAHLTAHDAVGSEAVALFVARAQAKKRAFALSDANAADVAEICRHLDGIPLAIELAAARINVLTPRELVQKLDERFRILSGGDRTALPRQQTMRALIDWSHDHLDESERRVFRRLACFAGSFTADAVADVCAADDLDDLDVLERLASLVEKSLVVSDSGTDQTRYRLLESIRAYANEKLDAAGEAVEVRRRHARVYVDRAERLKTDYESKPLGAWLQTTEPELENLRAALTCAFAPDGEVLVGQRIAATLDRLFMTSASVEALRWVEKARARVDDGTPREIVAQLALAEASLTAVLNRFRPALAAARFAREIFTELADDRGIADADRVAGRCLVRLGEIATAEPMLQAVLATYRRLGVERIGGVLRDLAVISGMRGDLSGARECFGRSLAVFRAGGDEENAALTAGALAEAEFQCGNAEDALAHAEQGLATMCAKGRDRMVAAFEGNIAAYLNALGRNALAAERAARSLAVARDVEAGVCVTFALQHLAAARALDAGSSIEDVEESLRLLGYVDARLHDLDAVREFTEQHEYDQALAHVKSRIDAERSRALLDDGAGWTEETAMAMVPAVERSCA